MNPALTLRPGYTITPLIIYLNVALALVAAFLSFNLWSFSPNVLLKLGALHTQLTLGGEWWRMLNSVFLHAGVWHLVLNMMALASFGLFLEPVVGRPVYLIIYLASGILASLGSVYFSGASWSVGASGAICGLAGMHLALLSSPLFNQSFRRTQIKQMMSFLGMMLLIGLLPIVNQVAHVSGFIAGFLLTWGFMFSIRSRLTKLKIRMEGSRPEDSPLLPWWLYPMLSPSLAPLSDDRKR